MSLHTHALLRPQGREADVEETGLNMTPMIDVVFQLLVFFLLSLKFKTVEQRIESRLPDVGQQPVWQPLDDTPRLTVKLFRERTDDPDDAFTRVRVAGRRTVDLPPGEWTGREDRDAERHVRYERAMDEVRQALAEIRRLRQGDPDLEGEIKTPPPKGAEVPHGDVVAVLDAFLEAGIAEVSFEGARSPLPK